MVALIEPLSARVRLRQWRESDLPDFAALNADAQVMAHFPQLLSRAQSDALAQRNRDFIAEHGWGFWAAEHRASGRFMGFIGLNRPGVALPFSPCVEIGWRLSADFWGQGLATEAARAALAVGFEQLHLPEIVSFTALSNRRSSAVMQRLGMRADAAGFEHPAVPPGHALRPHCLYRLQRDRWASTR
ncbi:MAG: N-acetyltransferase [Oceanococcus sp.]|nr:MAG: N-acetyltransferase [Oceanococcus sp.]